MTNKEIAIDLSRAIMVGDWQRVDDLLDESFTYVGDARPSIGKKAYVAFMRDVLCRAMVDMDMSFTRAVAEGDLVALEYNNAMTHQGMFLGVPGTGRRVVATGHLIREVKGGKVTAEWQTTNAMGLLAQLTSPGAERDAR
jgi:predicted ester cyclase